MWRKLKEKSSYVNLSTLSAVVNHDIIINIVEGGFGENQKCILVKDISEQHGAKTPDINKLINRNKSRFTNNDLIDLKNCQSSDDQQLNELGFTNMQIGKADNIYLLSERGYVKLVSMMDNSNEKKWEVMDKLIEEYFKMREVINSDENLKNQLLLNLFSDDKLVVANAHKEIVKLEIKEATALLIEEVKEKDIQLGKDKEWLN